MTKKNTQKYDITKEELNRLYLVEGKSTNEIAKIYGMKSHKTVSSYMKKFGIPMRSKTDGLMVKHNGIDPQPPITDMEKEIIIGEVLGDGNLTIWKKTNGGTPCYRHSSQFKKYLEWLVTIFPSLTWAEITKTIHSQKKKDGTNVESYNLRSLCHPDLISLYRDFYYINEKGKQVKKVPKNLVITPTILRHYFLGDGTAGLFSAGRDRKGKKKFCWQMSISACDYTKKEIEEILIPQLKNLGIIATLTHKKKKYRIRLSSRSFDRFYEIIGPCPVDCYSYKWMPEEVKNKFSIEDEKTYSREINLSFEDLLDEGPSSFIETDDPKELYCYFREEIGSRYWTIKDQNKIKKELRKFSKKRNVSLKNTTMVFNHQVEKANQIFKITEDKRNGIYGRSIEDIISCFLGMTIDKDEYYNELSEYIDVCLSCSPKIAKRSIIKGLEKTRKDYIVSDDDFNRLINWISVEYDKNKAQCKNRM